MELPMKANTKFIEDELFFQSLIANILSDEMSDSPLKSLIESKKEKKNSHFYFVKIALGKVICSD